ncbi:galactokinase [Tychonema sp. BBK16]|uniref:galactokinase n=1 Tax=Tychonema sp. BBK16 TaxID=2699888 RepID=UPI001F27B85C|nr:galactokinase [Tychonema sp. BBK16]MCF6375018.1 galactokinase [Tychonema sp. BBK16]
MKFQRVFGTLPITQASAPGRVNLLGEHTDYNEGFVIPTAIPQRTTVQIGLSSDHKHHFYSAELDELINFSDDDTVPQKFVSYICGCIRLVEKEGHKVPPINLYITSNVPIGVGLSSSASLEIATLRGLRSLLNLSLDDVQLAQIAQQAEIRYAGFNCGIMDQMAASLADTNSMLFIDTRTLNRRRLRFPKDTEILVIDSTHKAIGSCYNQRRAECEAAARMLGVKALRDIEDSQAVEVLPEPLRKRARYVVTENNRVIEAFKPLPADRFGQLMNASHTSLRDDYELSMPAVDTLVAILQETPGVFGARLTGGGFGGACVALVESEKVNLIASEAIIRYQHAGYTGRVLVPQVIGW